MSTLVSQNAGIAEFQNEPYTHFGQEANARKMRDALDSVRAGMGREYDLSIAGRRVRSEKKIESRNPSRPSELVGLHQSATAQQANEALQTAWNTFPSWSRTPAHRRIAALRKAAEILRRRKYEFNAWMVFEAGKSWVEAEADTSEAIDFCEYYARLMMRFADPIELPPMPGERNELRHLPLGVGIVIAPWNFPLAILCGMTVAALVTGNTVVVKPSSDTPTIAQKLAEVLLEAGFPEDTFQLITGAGSEIGDLLVESPQTRFISFTGSKAVGLRINELAARHQPGQIWIKRVIAEMGGKNAIIVADDADLEAAVEGVAVSAYGYQGQKCSACSRAIVFESIHDEFVERLKDRVARIRIGPAQDFENFMGPVINAEAQRSILDYVGKGKQESELLMGGSSAAGEGYFLEPTVFDNVPPEAVIFQEEIFGPVLGITTARDFDHALELANATEYGLTGAVYSRDSDRLRRAFDEFFVGNLYANRKCTGAMVGSHPFGGFNMSGTDSKAGGPDYLYQFLQPKSIAQKLLRADAVPGAGI